MLVAKNIHPKVNRQITTSNEMRSTENFLSLIFPLYLKSFKHIKAQVNGESSQ